jgi:hypothetical protein
MVFIKPVLLDTLPSSLSYTSRSGNGNFSLQSRKERRQSLMGTIGSFLPSIRSEIIVPVVGTAKKPLHEFEVCYTKYLSDLYSLESF